MTTRIIRAREIREKFGGIGNTTLHRYIENGTIPRPFKLGGVNAWNEADVDAHIEALADDHTSRPSWHVTSPNKT